MRHWFFTLGLGIGIVLIGGQSHAAEISLASLMDPNGFISEDAVTGSFGRIGLGNGSLGSVGSNTGDADGLYDFANFNSPNPGPPFDTVDLFPREADFLIGGLNFDENAISGSGVETTAITGIDLGEFWTSDPDRTNGTPGSPPTAISDISDRALGLWFFDQPGSIGFGALGANDTVTFSNGVLTSIDLSLDTTFDVAGTVWNGTFSVTGDQVSYQISDTQTLFGFNSTLGVNLSGTVASVGVYAVPEPSGLSFLACSLAVPLLRRRR
ncbi:MAG: hypothetical protein AAGA03_01645 [Planctomycetota bacterium]